MQSGGQKREGKPPHRRQCYPRAELEVDFVKTEDPSVGSDVSRSVRPYLAEDDLPS